MQDCLQWPKGTAWVTLKITIQLSNVVLTYLLPRLIKVGHFDEISKGSQVGVVKGILHYFNLRHYLNNNNPNYYYQIWAIRATQHIYKPELTQTIKKQYTSQQLFIMLQTSQDVGVVQVYKLKIVNHYNSKPIVPLLFKAILAEGASPVYIRYEDLKQRYPQILINFLQKKLQIITSQQQGFKTNQRQIMQSHQSNIQRSIQIKDIPQSIFRSLSPEEDQQNKSNQSSRKSKSCSSHSSHQSFDNRPNESIQAKKQPIRSCRLTKQPSLQKVTAVKRFREQNGSNSKKKKSKLVPVEEVVIEMSKDLDYDKIAIQLYGEQDYMYKYAPAQFWKKTKKKRRVTNKKSMSLPKRKKKKSKK